MSVLMYVFILLYPVFCPVLLFHICSFAISYSQLVSIISFVIVFIVALFASELFNALPLVSLYCNYLCRLCYNLSGL